jgi:hypothetical protein
MPDKVHFNITILLPPTRRDALLRTDVAFFENLQFELPFFKHTLSGTGRTLRFADMAIAAMGADVILRVCNSPSFCPMHNADILLTWSPLKNVMAAELSITTSNASVRVTNTTFTIAHLETLNGEIVLSSGTLNAAPSSASSKLALTSLNGSIRANLTLATSTSGGGRFNVTARTSNAPLVLDFTRAPPQSTLLLDAKTQAASARVALPPQYEGDYTLFSAEPELIIREGFDDPHGKGRTREVTQHRGIGLRYGNVRWVPKFKGEGRGLVGCTADGPGILVV